MAYENMTYEFILNRMISRVAEQYPMIDTREGSMVFNAVASAAIELAIMYTELENVRNESFVDTATREFLLLACSQIGIDTDQFNASQGSHKAWFNVEVPINSRWNCDIYNYTVTEYIGIEGNYFAYVVECETFGSDPNFLTGDLIPITDSPPGLEFAQIVECVIEGSDSATDEDIKTTYYYTINNSLTDGNVAQYEQWCSAYEGIGASKIFQLWNGPNTVKVSILSTFNSAASEQLIDEFQEYLDPGSTGMGDGVAPIGAIVTVTTADEIPINIGATIRFSNGYSDTESINNALNAYFSQIAYSKDVVNYMNIGSVILDVAGVESINDLTLNDGIADISIGEEEIPVLGETTWEVIT